MLFHLIVALFVLGETMAFVSTRSFGVSAISQQQLHTRPAILFMGTPYARPGDMNRKRPPPPPINENIRCDPVRLIAPKDDGDDGEEEMLGVYSLDEALEKADSLDLDLVLINENGDPPVCKIINYGKYKYSLEKKKKENMKKQSSGGLKEVKMSYKIDTHDFGVRVKAAQRFIKSGDRVKVVVQFKGREMQHRDLGRDMLMKFFEPINDVAVIESNPKMEGRAMSMMVGPKK